MSEKKCGDCQRTLPLSSFNRSGVGHQSYCRECDHARCAVWRKKNHEYDKIRQREYNHKIGKYRPLGESMNCSGYLGIYVAERVLSGFFDNITIMPPNNPGFDFICGRGFKIDVKSSCRRHYGKQGACWKFEVRHNKLADYFLCLAFDSRDSLNPEHVWLIPADHFQDHVSISISVSKLDKWSVFERPLDRVVRSCQTLRGNKSCVLAWL